MSKQEGSVPITDQKVIKTCTDNPDFTYLVSFSRTGSHWLRTIMELYFEKPALTRAFYFHNANEFTCYHTHDMDLQLRRQNVLYLYRDPVETVYSQLVYYKEDVDDQLRQQHWTSLYARHLSKWLVHDDFTQKKTELTYEGMKKDMEKEFTKVCRHFGQTLQVNKLQSVLERVSKEELKKRTKHDQQVVNLSPDYQLSRADFYDKYAEKIFEEILQIDPELRHWLTVRHITNDTNSQG